MGAVACERRGTHPGLLSCDHVHEAVANTTLLRSLAVHRFDIAGNGSTVVEHMLCAECAVQFGLSPGELIPEAVWGDERKFPYVYPLCAACFLEWRNQVQI